MHVQPLKCRPGLIRTSSPPPDASFSFSLSLSLAMDRDALVFLAKLDEQAERYVCT